MLKTAATLPFVAALLASNTVGLELVSRQNDESIESTALEALYASMSIHHGSGSTDGSNTKRSRMRRASHAAMIPRHAKRKHESGHKRSQSAATDPVQYNDVGKVDENDHRGWRPLFGASEKGLSIRRLYPSKVKGRPHLAPIDTNHVHVVSHSRTSSASSAASVCESPNVSPVTFRSCTGMMPCTGQIHNYDDCRPSGLPAQEQNVQQSPEPVRIINTATCQVSPFESAAIVPQRLPFMRSTSASSTGTNRMTTQNSHKKGHARNESVVSIWTVDSSPESSRSASPETNRRRPLSLHFRPPMANHNNEPLSAPIGKTFKFPAIDENEVANSHIKSTRPPIPPRTSSRQYSISSNRARSVTTNLTLPKSPMHAAESWDDDFGDLDVEVPANVRLSQQKVLNHLVLFRQFSEVIAELECMRDLQKSSPSLVIPPDHQIWHEIDAIIAIASRGQDETSVHDIEYQAGAQDDIISSILGQFKRDGGRVRLNDRILSTLIDKAQSLVDDLEYVSDRTSTDQKIEEYAAVQ